LRLPPRWQERGERGKPATKPEVAAKSEKAASSTCQEGRGPEWLCPRNMKRRQQKKERGISLDKEWKDAFLQKGKKKGLVGSIVEIGKEDG